MKEKLLFPLLACLAFFSVILVYLNHFDNEFQFDDFHTITDNTAIRSLKNIPKFFTDPTTTSTLPTHQSYRPGLNTLNAIDYSVWSWFHSNYPLSKLPMQFFFHLSIFIMYLIQGIALFFVLLKLFNFSLKHHWNRWLALFATSFYMLHTSNAETVNYIVQRADLYSTAFLLISFAIYMYWPKLRKWGIYLIPYLAGLSVKEPVVVMVPLLFLYLIFFEYKLEINGWNSVFNRHNRKIYGKAFIAIIPVLLIALVFLWLSLVKLRPETWIGAVISRWDYLKTQPFVIVHYFISFFLPLNLSVDTDWGLITRLADDRTLIGIGFIILMMTLAFKWMTKQETRLLSFGIFWFFLALLPTSSIIPLSEVLNDHRVFFPYVGLLMSVVWIIYLYIQKNESKIEKDFRWKNTIIMLAFLVTGLHAWGTIERNKVWDNAETLWYDCTLKSPRNGRGLMNYGLSQMNRGRYEKALQYFQQALTYSPAYPYLYINLANCKTALGLTDDIENDYKKAIQFGPDYYGGYHYYGQWLFQQKRYPEAISNLKTAIAKAPQMVYSRYVLMQLYFSTAMWPDLEALALEALSKFPGDATATYYLKQAQSNTGTIKDEAYYINLGLNYYNGGDYEKAIDAWQQALKKNPNNSLAYNNIGSAYNVMKQYDKAIPFLKKALEINPAFELARNNLKVSMDNLKK